MRSFFIAFLLCLGIGASAQTSLYVDSSVNASGSGSSWSTAFKTLGEALNTANAASTTTKFVISVAQGTYYPTGVDSSTNRDSAFCIFRGGVTVNGGFPIGGGSTRDIIANRTVLSGNIASLKKNNDNSLHLMVISNISASNDSIILSGLEFSDANADVTGSPLFNAKPVSGLSGGGLYITDVAANCLISECSFTGNRVISDGGAVYNLNGRTTFYSCTFEDNSASNSMYPNSGKGGALCIVNSSLPINILKSTFRDSRANVQGGAISVQNEALNRIDSCEFSSNYSGSYGGAIYSVTYGANPAGTVLSNSTFTLNRAGGNSSVASGGAYYGFHSSFTLIQDCSFIQNFAQYEAGGVYSEGYTSRSIFDRNSTAGSAGGGKFYNVDSCLFTNNKAAISGGAVRVMSQGSVVSNCRLFADTAGNAGGAIYADQRATIANCTVGKNVAPYGAGIYTEVGPLTLRNSVISGNLATINGGGLYSKKVNFTATSCLFSGNRAIGSGGAIFDSSANPTITNCTIARDSAANGNGIYNTNSFPVITNSIVWEGFSPFFNFNNSAPNVTYCVVEGGYSGSSNSSANPLFINPLPASAVPDTGGVYDVMPCSPAVGTGTNMSSYNGQTDVAGKPRLFASTVDRGAFECQVTYPLPITGKTIVCVGDTIRLAVALSGGTWTSNHPAIVAVDTNGVVTALGAGNPSITFSTGSGLCQNITTKFIQINALPVIGPISGKTAICQNDTIHFGSSTKGGAWFHMQPAISSLDTNGVFKGLRGGQDTVLYTMVSSKGCRDTVSSIITVNSFPTVAPIAGPSRLCENDTVTFTNATSGGVWGSYIGRYITVSQGGFVSAHGVGTDSIIYSVTSAAGCRSVVRTTVTVSPSPVISPLFGLADICMHSNPVLTVTPTGGIWSSDDTSIVQIGTGGILSPAKSGATTIRYIYTNTIGCSVSGAKDVSVIDIDTSVTVSGWQLRATDSGRYQWYDCDNGNIAIPGATSQTFTPTSNGTYSVSITANYCEVRSGCHTIRGLGISGGDRKDPGFAIIPNPASTSATIRLQKPGNYELSLMDPSGKLLLRQSMKGTDLNIDLSNYTPGIYFIVVISGTERFTQKLNILR